MLFGTETFELKILDSIQALLGCSFMDGLMTVFSVFFNYAAFWIVLAAVLSFTKEYRRIGLYLVVGLALSLILGNIILKPLIARPRPFMLNENAALIISRPQDFSFPSGHTYSSFLSAFVILKSNQKCGSVALTIAALVAFSRMYLYVHFPTDILGGIILAYILYKLSVFIVDKISDSHKKGF